MSDRLFDLEGAQERLGGLGRTSMFGLLKSGEIRAVRIGRRTMIPESEIADYIHRKMDRPEKPSDADRRTAMRRQTEE